MAQDAVKTHCLSITQWCTLAQMGAPVSARITLKGNSMFPLVRTGVDHVTIRSLTEPPKKGDVVLFHDAHGRYVVHRVVRIEGDKVLTQGDNCQKPDAWNTLSEMLGIVTHVERGRLKLSLNTPLLRCYGRIWMAMLPLRKLYKSTRRAIGRLLRRMHLRG